MPPTLPIDDPTAFTRAVAVLAAGGLIAFPTDTFYALGADPRREDAVRRLYALKGRPETKPVLLLAADAETAGRLWEAPDTWRDGVTARFWPGPLTVVARAAPSAPRLIGWPLLALRVPGNPATRALLKAVGMPLTGTSANRHGSPPPRSAREIAEDLLPGLDLILDGGTFCGTAASTIIEFAGGTPRILRVGAVSEAELRETGCMGQER